MPKNTEDGLTSTCRGINMGVWGGALSLLFCLCEDCLGKNLLLNAGACCIMLCALLLRIVINSILKYQEAFKCTVRELPPPPTTYTHTQSASIVNLKYYIRIGSKFKVCGGGGGRVGWLHSGNLHDHDSYLFSPPYQLHNLLVKLVPS